MLRLALTRPPQHAKTARAGDPRRSSLGSTQHDSLGIVGFVCGYLKRKSTMAIFVIDSLFEIMVT